MTTTVIAIDPGVSGGVAWAQLGSGIQACGMPETEDHCVELIKTILAHNQGSRIVAYIEQVTGYVAKPEGERCPRCNNPLRREHEPGSRMFTFGRGVGVFMGAFLMAGVTVHEVSPRTWQKPFFLNLKGKPKTERKRILKDAAQQRFPGLKVTLKTADALLLYAYGKLLEDQELFPPVNGKLPPEIPQPFASVGKKQFDALRTTLRQEVRPSGEGLFVALYKGVDCVFREVGTGAATLIHEADKHDLETLPRK